MAAVPPPPKPTPPAIVVRVASLSDAIQMGKLAARTHRSTELTQFLSPKIGTYYADYERGFALRSIARILDPRSLGHVACLESSPSTVVGYAMSLRLGDDDGARRHLRSRKALTLLLMRYIFGILLKIYNYVHPDRSVNPQAMAEFMSWVDGQEKVYWDPEKFPERKNRWHVQSVCVEERYQGMGIGKRVVAEVMRKAEDDEVVVGIEATRPGEMLYRRLDFELLGRFVVDFEQGGGGVMMWTPATMKKP